MAAASKPRMISSRDRVRQQRTLLSRRPSQTSFLVLRFLSPGAMSMPLRMPTAGLRRRELIQAGGSLALGSLLTPLAAQQQYSTLRIVNANAPGGATDLLCRTVANALQPGYAAS